MPIYTRWPCREGQEDQLGALLLLDHINVLKRHEFTLKESIRLGQLRPLREPGEQDDLAA